MIDLAELSSCSDLTSEVAKQAAGSSVEMRKLLKRVSEIAKPGEGCPKVLMVLARLVGQEWVEGDLRVEVSGDDKETNITIMSEHGFGIRERLLPLTRFEVPLDEFERALELAPHMMLPLRITDEPGKMVLTPLAVPEDRVKTVPPPEVAVDSASLGDGERTTAPPPADELQVVDEAEPYAEHVHDITTSPPPADAGMLDDVSPPQTPSVHTRPTVRRMVAIDAAAIESVKRRDPRREEE